MVMVKKLRKVDERAKQLIIEFNDQYNEYVGDHPEHKDRKREIFEAWVIHKLAGLQIAIERRQNGDSGEIGRLLRPMVL